MFDGTRVGPGAACTECVPAFRGVVCLSASHVAILGGPASHRAPASVCSLAGGSVPADRAANGPLLTSCSHHCVHSIRKIFCSQRRNVVRSAGGGLLPLSQLRRALASTFLGPLA